MTILYLKEDRLTIYEAARKPDSGPIKRPAKEDKQIKKLIKKVDLVFITSIVSCPVKNKQTTIPFNLQEKVIRHSYEGFVIVSLMVIIIAHIMIDTTRKGYFYAPIVFASKKRHDNRKKVNYLLSFITDYTFLVKNQGSNCMKEHF